jgi:DNA adenine methylase
MSDEDYSRAVPTGRFSPLRYPGGKGKVARFIAELVRTNDLSDGTYVEPYAGGAGVAIELLLTGVVRRIEINDISRPIHAFWKSVLETPDDLCRLISDTPVTVSSWDKAKRVFDAQDRTSDLELGFSTFFLNRTNRSGILNGGIIGGRDQSGPWKIDARYSKRDLVGRIKRIASAARRIRLTRRDAVQFLTDRRPEWTPKTIVYLDPPYVVKGGQLYYDSYSEADHQTVASAVASLNVPWIVSYDDAPLVRRLYQPRAWLRYTIGYSARERAVGTEVMFFSKSLQVPTVAGSMQEVDRGSRRIPVSS